MQEILKQSLTVQKIAKAENPESAALFAVAAKKKGVKMTENKATFCPNCAQPAIRSGNEITCENCDAVFTITKKQEAKVKEVGRLDNHEQRILALEGKQEPPKLEPESESEDEDEL